VSLLDVAALRLHNRQVIGRLWLVALLAEEREDQVVREAVVVGGGSR
jgi:hypothetical protein